MQDALQRRMHKGVQKIATPPDIWKHSIIKKLKEPFPNDYSIYESESNHEEDSQTNSEFPQYHLLYKYLVATGVKAQPYRYLQ